MTKFRRSPAIKSPATSTLNGQDSLPGTSLTSAQRRILAIALGVVLSGYHVINQVMDHLGGGATVQIWLDRYIPLRPMWVVPYSFVLAWWGIAIVWAYLRMEDSLYVAFVAGWVSACLIGYSIFIGYPTYMVRPEVTGTGWAEWLIRFTYRNDRVYNAFPSQHVWNTLIITLFWVRWKPELRWGLWSLTCIVALSALFIRQHWILDLIGGGLLGVIGYFIGLTVVTRLWPARHARPR